MSSSEEMEMTKCREKVCWCHDPTATKPPFCSHCGCSHVARKEDTVQESETRANQVGAL